MIVGDKGKVCLPGTKKIAKLLGLHTSGKGAFEGNFSGLSLSMKDSFGKKDFIIQVPAINYDNRVWLEQFHNPYCAREINTTVNNEIQMEFPGFPYFFPVDRICDAIKSTLQYFTIQYSQPISATC